MCLKYAKTKFIFLLIIIILRISDFAIAQEFKKRPFTFGYQVGICPFAFYEELQRSCNLSIDVFEIKKSYIGINIARFSANGKADCIALYSDPRVTTLYLIPPPPGVQHKSFYYTYKTNSYGLFWSKLIPKNKFNVLCYLSLNVMWNNNGFEQQSLFDLWPLTIYCKRKYGVSSQPTFDLFFKYGFFSKKEKRVNIAISPFIRYSYIKLNSIGYVDYGAQLDRISSIEGYTKHLFVTGLSIDFLGFRKKIK